MTSTQPDLEEGQEFGEGRTVGSRHYHYRSWTCPAEFYDLVGTSQFSLLALLGLREDHAVLDIGCGSLSAGRLLITYLAPDRYHGIEPETWVLEDGKQAHLGEQLLAMKRPSFSDDRDFTLTSFGRPFDFLVANSIFTHAPARQIHRCLEQARKVMHEDSVFLATYYQGVQDHEGDEWRYPWATTYTPGFMEAAAERAGLRCTHLDWPNLFEQSWVVITDPANPVDVQARLRGGEFSYPAYLRAGGLPHGIPDLAPRG